jgi:proline iminopeptidase
MKTLTLFLFLCFCHTLSAQDFEGLKKINGTWLYVKIIGKGEPLLIVHGGPGMNHSYFLPHLEKLAKKFRIVFYDQRASGKSVIPSTDSLSLKFFVDDIEAIRQMLGVEKINILGHSWGVILAVNYGISYPDKVKSMILCNPVPLSHEFDTEMANNQNKKATGKDSTDRSIIMGSRDFKSANAESYRKILMLSFRNSFYKPSNYSKLNFDMPADYVAASKALYTGLGKDLGQYNFYESVKSFSFPVLVIQGEVDAIPLAASTRTSHSIPKASLVIFKKSGHFVFIEEPGKFTSIVTRFIKRVK